MAYTIVEEYDRKTMIELIESMEKEGWKPQGGICVTCVRNGEPNGPLYDFTFFQAMYKEETLISIEDDQ